MTPGNPPQDLALAAEAVTPMPGRRLPSSFCRQAPAAKIELQNLTVFFGS
ncbi:MAG: hypothetical protein ACM3JH_00760 [Acidithiobacillales bacterium]